MTSLFENNKSLSEITVYIFGLNLSDFSKSRLKDTAEKYGRKIYFQDMGLIDALLENSNACQYTGSYTPYYRLFFDESLPLKDGNVLYLDSDTVIVDSLDDLESYCFGDDKACAMTLAQIDKTICERVGLPEGYDYFNSGVLLLNLNNWKKLKCRERVLHDIEHCMAETLWADQDILARAIQDNIAILPARFNIMPFREEYETGNNKSKDQIDYFTRGYSDEESDYGDENPAILHYTYFLTKGLWRKNENNRFMNAFCKYKEMSLWHDFEYAEQKLPKIKAVKKALKRVKKAILPKY